MNRKKARPQLDATSPVKASREWHFDLTDITREYDGKIYSVGICVREIDAQRMVCVGEVKKRDARTGANPETLICSSVYEAIKYIKSLGEDRA